MSKTELSVRSEKGKTEVYIKTNNLPNISQLLHYFSKFDTKVVRKVSGAVHYWPIEEIFEGPSYSGTIKYKRRRNRGLDALEILIKYDDDIPPAILSGVIDIVKSEERILVQ